MRDSRSQFTSAPGGLNDINDLNYRARVVSILSSPAYDCTLELNCCLHYCMCWEKDARRWTLLKKSGGPIKVLQIISSTTLTCASTPAFQREVKRRQCLWWVLQSYSKTKFNEVMSPCTRMTQTAALSCLGTDAKSRQTEMDVKQEPKPGGWWKNCHFPKASCSTEAER